MIFGQAMEKISGQETSAARTKLVLYAYEHKAARICRLKHHSSEYKFNVNFSKHNTPWHNALILLYA